MTAISSTENLEIGVDRIQMAIRSLLTFLFDLRSLVRGVELQETIRFMLRVHALGKKENKKNSKNSA